MKKVNVILAVLIVSGLMTGCGGNKSRNATDETRTVAEVHGITMTLKPKGEIKFSLGGNRTATVDWGDGSPVETVTLSIAENYFTPDSKEYIKHNYAQQAEYAIKITGENIIRLYCSGCNVTNLDLNVPTLKDLRCEYNQLTTLDVSKNTELKELECDNNQLTSLDVSKNTALIKLACYNNRLTSLDVSKNTALTKMWCNGNQLTSLDVSKNTALTDLSCDDNSLTTLDVSKNTALIKLACCNNRLTSLDVSKNTALTDLSCFGNQLTSLDVSKNTALTDLSCDDNSLTTLDVSKNTALIHLGCSGNQLSENALNALFHTLCNNGNQKFIRIYENPGYYGSDRSIAEEKGWEVGFRDLSAGDIDQSDIIDEEDNGDND